MKPETIERRNNEQLAKEAREREEFLKTYAIAKTQFPELPEAPTTGARFSVDLIDGRWLNISIDRMQVF